jgi:DNA-binding IclR family transcriptional regulator
MDAALATAHVEPALRYGARPGERETPDRGDGFVKSGARSLQVLEFFFHNRRPARTSEISRFIGVPNSSTDELLRTMAALGYVAFNPRNRCYAPSYRLFSIGKGLEQSFFSNGAISETLRDIADATGETVVLAAENRHQLQLMMVERRKWDDPELLQDGRRKDLLTKIDGQWRVADNFSAAVLSSVPELSTVEMARRLANERGENMALGELQPLITSLQKVRRAGYAVCRRGPHDIDSIAMPLPPDGTNVQAAVGIIGWDLFRRPERQAQLLDIMRRAADRLQSRRAPRDDAT